MSGATTADPLVLELKRREATLFVPVEVVPWRAFLGAGWAPGPLQLTVPNEPGQVTDADWRARQLTREVCDALHAPERRIHRRTDGVRVPGTSLVVFAVELQFVWEQREVGSGGVLIVHARGESDGRKFIADLKRSARDLDATGASEVRAFYDARLGVDPTNQLPLGRVTPATRQATVLTLVTEVQPSFPKKPHGKPWTSADHWRWSLALASPPADKAILDPHEPPTPGVAFAAPDRVFTVLPRGVSIVGTRGDHNGEAGPQFDFHEVAVHSVYADVLAFGVIQDMVLRQVAADLAGLDDPVRSPRALRQLQRHLRVFRNRYWWKRVSRWTWPDRMLDAFIEQQHLDDVLEGTINELRDFSAEAEVVRSQRTSEVLGLVALLGLPAVAASVLQALGAKPDVAAVVLSCIGALVLIPVLWLVWRLLGSFRRVRDDPRL